MQSFLILYFGLIFFDLISVGIGPTPSVLQILSHPRFDLAAEDDYLDEISFGKKRITDLEKYEREKDCMCLKHLKDPHCGSDNKVYDNGCFFLCAQKKNEGLRLKRWGDCDDDSLEDRYIEDLDKMIIHQDFDYVDDENVPHGYVEA